MKSLSVKNRIYLTITAFAISSAAFAYFVIYPGILEIIDTAAKMEETRLAIEKKYLSGQFLRRASLDVEKVKQSTSALSSIFILKGEEYLFLPEFEKQMDELGYKTFSTDLSESSVGGKKISPSDTLSLAFSLQGDFPALMKSLADLRQISQYINVDRIEFQSLENGLIQMNVKSHLYRIDPEKIKSIIDDSKNNQANKSNTNSD